MAENHPTNPLGVPRETGESLRTIRYGREPNGESWRTVDFQGQAKEYFGIWIVNILLSILTLGIYSAWAKVRRLTYFHNKTSISGYPFGYHATGWRILKGRIIAIAVFILIQVILELYPLSGIPIIIASLFLAPWLLNASVRFSARMTSWRNIRFNWRGTYWKTFFIFIIGPLAGLISAGLLIPLMSRYYYRYFASYHDYGTSRFSAHPRLSDFYWKFLSYIILPSTLAAFAGTAAMTEPFEPVTWDSIVLEGYAAYWFHFSIRFVLMMIFFMIYLYPILCRNILMKTLTLDHAVTFDSRLNPYMFTWIALSNTFLIIISAGLLLPWAQIRAYRYWCSGTFLKIHGSLDEFVGNIQQRSSAIGEEIAEFEGLEASI